MKPTPFLLLCMAFALSLFSYSESNAYERYKDPGTDSGWCSTCHGDFTSATSPKGNTIPGNSKHTMHRGAQNMDAECNLCHTSSDDNNPFIGSSDGTANSTGYGCVGCHGRLEDSGVDGTSAGHGAGLRQHHETGGFGGCQGCHSDANPASYTPVGEQFRPQYYGVIADSNVANPCNPTAAAEINENWTTGDFEGMDNDGDDVYDGADTDCPAAGKTRGDFEYNGRADILWRNTSSGSNWLYAMNGAGIDDSSGINVVGNLNWSVVGKGDYDGNGTADILWRNSSTGQVWVYLMVG